MLPVSMPIPERGEGGVGGGGQGRPAAAKRNSWSSFSYAMVNNSLFIVRKITEETDFTAVTASQPGTGTKYLQDRLSLFTVPPMWHDQGEETLPPSLPLP